VPEVEYELRISADDPQSIEMQVISYDSEGENLAGVKVHVELAEATGSFAGDRQTTHIDLVTDSRGKAYFRWQAWPEATMPGDGVCLIKASWEGRDPFVFIERYREVWHGGV
jgi:hypothetical protein